MKILAVIPARGGSKGIPRKNIRLMNGKPLIAYAIENSSNSKYITDTVVSTDDDEIATIAELYGAEIIRRPDELANDSATLDPVIYHALKTMEERKICQYDAVVTLQPTSPLLTVATLDSALEKFECSDFDCIISAINAPHLSWGKINGEFVPNYKERLNRQQLPANYLETGAFFISRRNIVTEKSRIGGKISVYEIPKNEAVDIDNISDWIVCESSLKRKKIVLRCDGNKQIGMGHIYHCISLAHNLIEHDVTIVTNSSSTEGCLKLRESNLKVVEVKDDEEFFEYVKQNGADIVVNDCLDSTEEYMRNLKAVTKRLITIEDMGEGTIYADAVINALYEPNKFLNSNTYCGPDFVCLREEFTVRKPNIFNEKVKNVVVLFGGTDPSNLTSKILKLAKMDKYKDITFNFILGIGNSLDIEAIGNIKVQKNVKNVSYYMAQADLAFTSQGRTVYELASLGIPSIVMSQNEREKLHTFAYMENGFVNLGLGQAVDIDTIEHTLDWLINTPYLRQQMRELMLKTNLRNGIKNEINIILND